MPKSDDEQILDSLRAAHPTFEDVANWEAGPNPPDFLGTRRDGVKIGLELTEWLDAKQATPSIARTDSQYRWLEALATEKRPRPNRFDRVVLLFKKSTKFNEHDVQSFCDDFYALVRDADEHPDRSFLEGIHEVISDLSRYPTLRRHVSDLFFEHLPDKFRVPGQRWVATAPKFYPDDPERAVRALLESIQKKISKYPGLAKRLGLHELVLVVHYGLRGVLHASPHVRVDHTLEGLLSEVRSRLRDSLGPFSKIYLYIALNDGPLHLLYPTDQSSWGIGRVDDPAL